MRKQTLGNSAFFIEGTTYGMSKANERKLYARNNPEACVVNFEEIYKRLGEG